MRFGPLIFRAPSRLTQDFPRVGRGTGGYGTALPLRVAVGECGRESCRHLNSAVGQGRLSPPGWWYGRSALSSRKAGCAPAVTLGATSGIRRVPIDRALPLSTSGERRRRAVFATSPSMPGVIQKTNYRRFSWRRSRGVPFRTARRVAHRISRPPSRQTSNTRTRYRRNALPS